MAVAGHGHWWAGTPLAEQHWLEGPSGFPPGGVADERAANRSAGEDPLAEAEGLRLTRRHVHEVVAFTELLAGRALDATARTELVDDLTDAFEDAPHQALRSLHPLRTGLAHLTALDPVRRAERRLQALTVSYLVERRRDRDGLEPSPVMAAVRAHNADLRVWSASGVVLVADALVARHDQHRVVLALVGHDPEPGPALADRLLARTAEAGTGEIAELAASEVRLLALRRWLRELGASARQRLRADLGRAVPGALDVDLVVQQLCHRAAVDHAAGRAERAGRAGQPSVRR